MARASHLHPIGDISVGLIEMAPHQIDHCDPVPARRLVPGRFRDHARSYRALETGLRIVEPQPGCMLETFADLDGPCAERISRQRSSRPRLRCQLLPSVDVEGGEPALGGHCQQSRPPAIETLVGVTGEREQLSFVLGGQRASAEGEQPACSQDRRVRDHFDIRCWISQIDRLPEMLDTTQVVVAKRGFASHIPTSGTVGPGHLGPLVGQQCRLVVVGCQAPGAGTVGVDAGVPVDRGDHLGGCSIRSQPQMRCNGSRGEHRPQGLGCHPFCDVDRHGVRTISAHRLEHGVSIERVIERERATVECDEFCVERRSKNLSVLCAEQRLERADIDPTTEHCERFDRPFRVARQQ